ncbi:MAG TPA: DEAD/DEAH box helicase [Candidatus Saccharimonadales bacterium]|nr:DEAD/DEAH box helicase [Candidatus Saccharimonadales bacterium]
MPPVAELPPITDERRLAVARWVETNVRPVLHVVAEDAQQGEQPQQEFEMRDYQIDAWAKLEVAREEGRARALGNLATGLGKTFVAAVDVLRYREWCAVQDPPIIPRILYVSHQKDINDQAAKTFKLVMPNAEMAFFKTKRKQLPDADITFATLQSLYSELDRFDPQDFEYIVWDESHHLEADTYKAVRDYFDPLFEHAITASLERSDGKDIQDYFGVPLYQKILPEGIAEGHLAEVDYHIVFDKAIKDKLKQGFDPKTLQEIKELFSEKPPAQALKRSIEEEIERLGLKDPKTIIFCENIDEAEEMAELLNATAFHSRSADRDNVLDDFRAGKVRRITARDMLNEGVDVPDAELIIFLRSTKSGIIFEQQLGRGLRRTKGKTKVYVLDFVANIERIAKVRELSKNIQRRAAALGQRDAGEEGAMVGDGSVKEPHLRVHTRHGDFDFDKIAIDLLEKYNTIRSEEPRDGEMSMVEFAEQMGTTYITVAKLVEELQIPTPTRRFGIKTGKALTPDAQALLQGRPELKGQAAQGIMSVKAFAQSLGVGERTVKTIIETHGLPTIRTKFSTATGRATKPGQGLEPATQQRIKELLAPKAPSAQNGEVSITAFARSIGSSHRTLSKLIEKYGIPTVDRDFNNVTAPGLSIEAQQQILNLPEFG